MQATELFHIAIDPLYDLVELNFGKAQADELLHTQGENKVIFDAFYKAVSAGMGEKVAFEIASQTLEHVKRNYEYEIVGEYLKQLPDYLFDSDRVTYISRKELETLVNERTKELTKLKDDFFFMATHDLRAPITAISGYVELINEKKDALPGDVQKDLTVITESTQRLKKLVNELLEIARSEANAMNIELSTVDVFGVISNVIAEASAQASSRGISLSIVDTPQQISAIADITKLTEVLENLISNAVKYNKDNGWVNVSAKRSGEFVEITVSDGGYGIPANQQAKVFQKFFRAQLEATKQVPGTGLGLTITKMMVEKMNGTIDFHSKENEGTTFMISLKAA